MSLINKETLDRLAELARIELSEKEKKVLLHDLQVIVDYFNELQTLDTKNIPPIAGGTSRINVLRDDESQEHEFEFSDPREQFPDRKDDHLEIPPVFE